MKAVVTGVTGFAGGHLAEHLLASGDEVLGISRRSKWPAYAPDSLRDGVRMLRWDLADGAAPGEVREELAVFAPDCLYHLAAISVPDQCGQHEPTAAALKTNVEGTLHVLRLAASLPSRPKILFTSTSHVYAPVSLDAFRLDETAAVGSPRGYGKSKLLAEELAVREAREQKLGLIVARAFQHAGPRQSPELMLAQWARQFAQDSREPVLVYNLDTYIDLTDVRDVVRAYRLLVLHSGSGGTYNIGSGKNRRTGDVFGLLHQMANPQRSVVELRPGRKQEPVADNRRLVEQTGWTPEIPLKQTVADTLADWRRRILYEPGS